MKSKRNAIGTMAYLAALTSFAGQIAETKRVTTSRARDIISQVIPRPVPYLSNHPPRSK